MPYAALHLTILVKAKKEGKPNLPQFIQSTTSVKGFISLLIHGNSSKFGQSNA
jgi:hypothetical protein